MLTIAVTGGIGSGKSTVSGMLADLGAVLVDSDRLARDVVAPGTAGLAAVTEEFGPGVLAADGSLDRAALARIVFSDDEARHRLEAITHPLVRQVFRAAREAAGPGAIVVNDIPLVRTVADAAQFHLVVTVVADGDRRIERLARRGLTEQDARARMQAQISDDERRALSDVVLDNDGEPGDLRCRVHRLWSQRLVPFQENLLAGRPAERAVRTAGVPDGPSPLPVLCARVSAAVGGLACRPVQPAGPDRPVDNAAMELEVTVPDLAAADGWRPSLTAAGFPRADDPADDPADDAADDPADDAGGRERRHASADPERSVNLYLRVRESSTMGGGLP